MMKFLRCKVCGKIVAMVNDCSSCPTKCCGEPMEEIPVNTQDGAHEKHLPVYKQEGNILKVRIGEVDHPMLEAHYIQWIALQTDKGNQKKYTWKRISHIYLTFVFNKYNFLHSFFKFFNLITNYCSILKSPLFNSFIHL